MHKSNNKLRNSEQSYKGKVKTHNYINRQNQSTTENCENRNDPDLVQALLKKWWVESDFKAPNLLLSLRFIGQYICVRIFKYLQYSKNLPESGSC